MEIPSKPTLIAIDPDDYHAQYAGWTNDGRQAFLTTPFVAASDQTPGCEYVALFLFDRDGHLDSAVIETCGPRSSLDHAARIETRDLLLASIGPLNRKRITIRPFAIDRDGVEFGFVLREPEDEDDVYAVELQPGNYMAFFEPWDSGVYDT